MRKRFHSVVIVAALACPTVVPARVHENWPYDRLFKEADLVVFATAVKTEAAEDKPPEHSWPLELTAQNTAFKVNHSLKGKPEGDQIKVLHFRIGELKKGLRLENKDVIEIIDGPLLVTFRTDAVFGQEYLLFLKRLKDGRYVPISGQIDPALSVREVSAPDDKARGKGGL